MVVAWFMPGEVGRNPCKCRVVLTQGFLVSEVGRNSPNTIFVEFGVVLTLVELSRGF